MPPSASGELYAAFCGQTGGSIVGAIIQSGGSVSYFAASDYRLKDDLGPVADPVGQLMQLQPKRLRWKDGGQEFDGFIAHEAQTVVPYAVTGEKDAVNDDDSIKGSNVRRESTHRVAHRSVARAPTRRLGI